MFLLSQKGHTEDTCWKKHPHLKPPSTKSPGSKAEEKTTPTKSEPSFKYEAKGLMNSKNKVKNDDYFYVDFACMWTMTGSREWLKNIKWYKTTYSTIAGGSGKPNVVIRDWNLMCVWSKILE